MLGNDKDTQKSRDAKTDYIKLADSRLAEIKNKRDIWKKVPLKQTDPNGVVVYFSHFHDSGFYGYGNIPWNVITDAVYTTRNSDGHECRGYSKWQDIDRTWSTIDEVYVDKYDCMAWQREAA